MLYNSFFFGELPCFLSICRLSCHMIPLPQNQTGQIFAVA
jgi:hypothetical protein